MHALSCSHDLTDQVGSSGERCLPLECPGMLPGLGKVALIYWPNIQRGGVAEQCDGEPNGVIFCVDAVGFMVFKEQWFILQG